MTRTKILTGLRFGRLLIQADLPKVPPKVRRVLAVCDCGVVKTYAATEVMNGNVKSCGCLARQRTAERSTIHGKSRTPTYGSWVEMRNRCNSKSDPAYPRYGGRGITICERWNSYANFLSDMGEKPPGLSLDRYPDNNGNYEPTNCRWATRTEQSRNRRNTMQVVFAGKVMALGDACESAGIKYGSAHYFLRKCGEFHGIRVYEGAPHG